MNEHDDRFDLEEAAEPPRDELDGLLRAWHEENRQRAAAGRDRLLAALAGGEALADAGAAPASDGAVDAGAGRADVMVVERTETSTAARGKRRPVIAVIRRVAMHRLSHLVAALLALAVLLPFILPGSQPAATAGIVMVPEGGRLVAFAEDGEALGPCVLKHTDVDVDIAGPFARITLNQTYSNPHADKIEAVYTFPMSHRAAVDRMKMVIGNRVIEGEVKERALAQQIYTAAKAEGRVASLLEQERPNIFTQSIANIEPGAEIAIEISYIEVLPSSEGEYTFSFPTTVAPRYIPGAPIGSAPEEDRPAAPPAQPLPEPFRPRRGLVLLGPPELVEILSTADGAALPGAASGAFAAALAAAEPIQMPGDVAQREAMVTFAANYVGGGREIGVVFEDGAGQIGGRWFYMPPLEEEKLAQLEGGEGGFSGPTDHVPDAGRITPMPVHPSTRAGHDISITVNIDTGGPGILNLTSPLHEIVRTEASFRDDGVPRRATVKLKNLAEIPNRDFVLSWKQTAERIEDQVFTSAGGGLKGDAGFFTLLLQPPQRVAEKQAVPRELLFVLDVSGSMSGEPIAKARDVLRRALGSMRPQDRFNIIKFNNQASTLWDEPRPATEANLAAARAYFEREPGGGGTEMLSAIRTALKMPRSGAETARADGAMQPADLLDLPADGRRVRVAAAMRDIRPREVKRGAYIDPILWIDDTRVVRLSDFVPPHEALDVDGEPGIDPGAAVILAGRWETVEGARILTIDAVTRDEWDGAEPANPLRLIVLLSDGEIGNDMAVLDVVKNKPADTRFFTFSIGNSANRYLLDQMATLGGGKAAYVLQTTDAAAVVEAFARRINTPVLTNVNVDFLNVRVSETFPPVGQIGDLYDVEPLVMHGRIEPAVGGGIENGRDDAGGPRIIISGMSGAGPWRKEVPFPLAAAEDAVARAGQEASHDQIATLWARAKVESLMNQDLAGAQRGAIAAELKDEIVALGERFNLLTQYTAFVAVDKLRITVGGQPRLVHVPIELPNDATWEGYFGPPRPVRERDELVGFDRDAFDSRPWPESPDKPLFNIELRRGENQSYGSRAVDLQPMLGESAVGMDPDLGFASLSNYPNSPAGGSGQSLFDGVAGGYAADPVEPTPATAVGQRAAESEQRGRRDGVLHQRRSSADPAETAERVGAPARPGARSQSSRSPRQDDAAPAEKASVMTDLVSEPELVGPEDAAHQRGVDPIEPDPLPAAVERATARIRDLITDGVFNMPADLAAYAWHPVFAPTLVYELHGPAPDAAAALAEEFATLYPDDDLLTRLHAAYLDETLDEAALAARVEELAKESWAKIREVERLATLERRLDPRLLALVRGRAAVDEAAEEAGQGLGAAPAVVAARAAETALPMKDGRLQLSILVADVDAARKAVTTAGATVVATDGSMRLIIAAAAPEALEDLALTPGVRRIEPVVME